MKKQLALLTLTSVLLSMSLAEAAILTDTAVGDIVTDASYLKATLVNQDPTSADPGSYVELLFKLENWGTENAEDVKVELLPEYPFSLDSNVNALKDIGMISGLQTGNNAYLIRYKVRVAEDAIDGDNEIKLKYFSGEGDSYYLKTFNISVDDPKTDIEVVLQDSSSSSTTLAIANIGSNAAYSVIVTIPEQESFRVTGTSSSIIGNLDASDYTLASFELSQTGRTADDLIVEVSYTDLLGIRRSVQKEIPLDFSSSGNITSESMQSIRLQSQSSNGLLYIVIGVVGIVVIVLAIKFRKFRPGKKK